MSSRIYAADDPEVGVRLRALTERSRNVCYNRMSPRPPGDCWCKVLATDSGSVLPCPPAPAT